MAEGSLTALTALEVVGWGLAVVVGLIAVAALYLLAVVCAYVRVPEDRPL